MVFENWFKLQQSSEGPTAFSVKVAGEQVVIFAYILFTTVCFGPFNR
jgi:hypothetical protein